MVSLDLLKPQTPKAQVPAKLAALRSRLAQHQLDAYFVPSADEHLNEYLPEAKQRRQWMSGFSGSVGDFLVGQEQAWLFVDFRYYEQADFEVDASLIQICKVGLDGHKNLIETLEELGQNAIAQSSQFRLGFDPFTLTVEQFRSFAKQLEPLGVELVAIPDNLVDQVRQEQPWADADPIPAWGDSSLIYLSEPVTGEDVPQKLSRIREAMQKSRVDLLPVTKLDQIAWLFNLRGGDIPYNPVFIAYAVITLDQAFLFTNLERIDPTLQATLQTWVTLQPYETYAATLISLAAQASRVWLDPNRNTLGTYNLLKEQGGTSGSTVAIAEADHPIEGMKARKNATEVAQMQSANLKASRAKIRTLKWLSEQWHAGQPITELDVANTIAHFYQAEADYQGLSFNTIAGAGANSSIVHYGTPSGDRVLQAGEFLLLDSGAQYLGGTTDATRTVVVGQPTSDQIARYTAVLRAHINCAMQRFPKGTTGAQLDGITRSVLWASGLDYGHGTGHGVGAFLNVHEGPNGISKRAHEPLEPGMVTSIEPGFYQPGWGGIRLENLYVVKALPTPEAEGSAPSWYGFESLAYIPFESQLIDFSQLDPTQRQWLEEYYSAILAKLTPLLDESEVQWLQKACELH